MEDVPVDFRVVHFSGKMGVAARVVCLELSPHSLGVAFMLLNFMGIVRSQ